MFWSDYPWWKHLFGRQNPFHAFPFEHSPVPLPAPFTGHQLSCNSPHQAPVTLSEVCAFLYSHFSTTPRLVFTPNTLLGHQDYLFLVLHENTIVGTIRYHFIGTLITPLSLSSCSSRSSLTSPPVYVVDAFCIHPMYRKRGIGTYLLAELHRYANQRGISCALFLKEGPALPVLPLPLYSGRYVYCRIPSSPVSPVPVVPLTKDQAHQWVSIYLSCQPNTLVILNKGASNQCWRAYREGNQSILACIQDTHQQMITGTAGTAGTTGQRMGWVTVWLESPLITDTIRQRATSAISHTLQDYTWLWMNRKWAGYSVQDVKEPWKEDGGFHWYSYQFTTGLSMEHSYGIMS